ncbi:MAG: helix-turn-helix domain-containing protein [Firmicutes bacterium]|jgi:transcriptional regulator with XRE-family HTH domain|nr:helix-turn-helix domain-containing protein [Bacillota bacterium]
MKRKYEPPRRFSDRLKEELKDNEFRQAFEEADFPVRLAIVISKLREKKGLSQEELAQKVGTKQQVISRIEQLQQTNLTLAMLQKLAAAFQMRLIVDFQPARGETFVKKKSKISNSELVLNEAKSLACVRVDKER